MPTSGRAGLCRLVACGWVDDGRGNNPYTNEYCWLEIWQRGYFVIREFGTW
jgi:hypothetical protein